MDNVTFERRLRDLYQQAMGGVTYTRGMRSWFARKAGVTPRTVGRWISGESPVSGPAIGLLEALEREANR